MGLKIHEDSDKNRGLFLRAVEWSGLGKIKTYINLVVQLE